MLTEQQKKQLKDMNICDETIELIESYDDSKQIVTFKDGTEHQIVECMTRVMGYLRPVSQFNKGKQSEFNERKWFTEDKIGVKDGK